MPAERCVKWEPVSGIKSACADISFELNRRDELAVSMHFSSIAGQPRRDLRLRFEGVISLRWVEESFDVIDMPKPWPQIGAGDHPTWTFPLLQIEHSTWIQEHENTNPLAAIGRVHFALISLNDLIHILAFPEVTATWIDVTPNTYHHCS